MAAQNVIWIFGDQHRAQALGYQGDPNVFTPNYHREEISRFEPVQDRLNPVSVFRRNNRKPEPQISQSQKGGVGPFEEFSLTNHHQVGMLNEQVFEFGLDLWNGIAREVLESGLQAKPDGLADCVLRNLFEAQPIKGKGDAGCSCLGRVSEG